MVFPGRRRACRVGALLRRVSLWLSIRKRPIWRRRSIKLEGQSVPGPVNKGATAIDGFATGGDLDDLNIVAVREEIEGTRGQIVPVNKQVGEVSREGAQRCALGEVFSSE